MADAKISALSNASALGGSEQLAGVQSAANVNITPTQIKTFTSASPTLVTPNLGTPSAGVLTNCTGLPVSSGVSGLGTGVGTFLGTPSSANLAAALTDETGTGAAVFATSPTLVTPALGTPASGVLTNCTGTASGLTAGVVSTISGLITAGSNVTITGAGTSGSPYSIASSGGGGGGGGDALVANPLSQFAATTSLQLKGVISDETGSGALVFATSPTLVTPALGTPASGALDNCTISGATAANVAASTKGILASNTQNANYTFVLADAGKAVCHTDGSSYTYTIPPHSSVAYSDGAVIVIDNNSAVSLALAPGAAVTLYHMDGTSATGSFTIPAYSMVSIRQGVTNDYWYLGAAAAAGTMVYPGAGIAVSTGSAWNTSITAGTGVATALAANVTGSGGIALATSPTLVTPALGTPSSGTLTSCTGLPVAGITASTSTALGVGSIELGHATDTTIARSGAGAITVEGVQVILSGAALGTPSSGTLTSCTGLPVAGITASTSTALGVGSIELGHASDTTLSRASAGQLAVEGVNVVMAGTIIDAVEFVIDGAGSALTTGIKGYVEVPYACTINRATLLADVSGSVVVDVFKCTYSAFDPTTHPASADKITASAPPTISSAKKAQDSTLTGWTTSISAGDILGFNVNSATTITRVTISLKVTRS